MQLIDQLEILMFSIQNLTQLTVSNSKSHSHHFFQPKISLSSFLLIQNLTQLIVSNPKSHSHHFFQPKISLSSFLPIQKLTRITSSNPNPRSPHFSTQLHLPFLFLISHFITSFSAIGKHSPIQKLQKHPFSSVFVFLC
jgi:hypothetical protein